jgi:hypothetical protein
MKTYTTSESMNAMKETLENTISANIETICGMDNDEMLIIDNVTIACVYSNYDNGEHDYSEYNAVMVINNVVNVYANVTTKNNELDNIDITDIEVEYTIKG